jgi:hypothetical protein
MQRSKHLLEGGPSGGPSGGSGGLAQSTRTIKVGTFGSRRIPDGESRSYSLTVAEGGSIEPGPQFNPSHDRIDGRQAKGKIFGPGGYDGYRVTGPIVDYSLPSELTFEGSTPALRDDSGGNGSGKDQSGSNGDSNGDSNGGGSGGGGGGSDMPGQTQQAGMSTSTLLVGGAVLAAAGVAAYSMSGDGQSR